MRVNYSWLPLRHKGLYIQPLESEGTVRRMRNKRLIQFIQENLQDEDGIGFNSIKNIDLFMQDLGIKLYGQKYGYTLRWISHSDKVLMFESLNNITGTSTLYIVELHKNGDIEVDNFKVSNF